MLASMYIYSSRKLFIVVSSEIELYRPKHQTEKRVDWSIIPFKLSSLQLTMSKLQVYNSQNKENLISFRSVLEHKIVHHRT